MSTADDLQAAKQLPAHHTWYQVFLPDRGAGFFLYLLSGMLFLRPELLLWDGGSCRHIINGLMMLRDHVIPSTNYASAIFPNSECTTRAWLSDLTSGYFYQQHQLTGVVCICSFVIALGLTWSYQMGRARGFGLASGMTLLAVVMATVGMHWSARSHVYSYLPFLLTFYLVFMTNDERKVRTTKDGLIRAAMIGVSLCLWANLHGSFMIGMGMLLLRMVCEAIAVVRNEERAVAVSEMRFDAVALFVGVLGTCINPRGIGFYTHVVGYLANPNIVHKTDEWRAFDIFAGLGSWAYLILIFIGARLIWNTKKVASMAELIFFILMILAGFNSMRLIPYAALIALPILGPAWRSLRDRFESSDLPDNEPTEQKLEDKKKQNLLERCINFEARAGSQEPHGLKIAIGSIAISIALAAAMLFAPFAQIKEFDPERLPVKAVEFMKQNKVSGLGFNYDNWGGYIYFMLDKPVFIDDWADFLPNEFIDQYIDILTAKPGWETKFAKYKFDWVLVPNESQLAQLLSKSPDWRVDYKDKVSVLLVKRVAGDAH